MLLKIFLTGWVILLVAIVLNILADRLGITTWHVLAENAAKAGLLKSFLKTSMLSKVFLLVIYPGILGAAAYFTLKLFK